MKYTESQISFIIKQKLKGDTYSEIMKDFNKKFKCNKSVKAIENVFNRYGGDYKKQVRRGNKSIYTESQISFIIEQRNKGLTLREITIKFNDKYKVSKSAKSIEHVLGRCRCNVNLEAEKKRIVNSLLKFVKNKDFFPKRSQLRGIGLTESSILTTFEMKSLQEFFVYFRNTYNIEIFDEHDFSKERWSKTLKEIKKYKNFVVTSVMTGSKVDLKCFKTLKHYCKLNNAALLILPCSDPAKDKGFSKFKLDYILKDELIVWKDLWLNKNVLLSSIKLSAKQIIPLTGLSRISKNKKSGAFIFASPKHFLKFLPVKDNSKPKAMMTACAITVPDYKTIKFMSKRTEYIAAADHKMGAWIFSIKNSKIFRFRNIEFFKNGSFSDLDKTYHSNGKVTHSVVELLALGDSHSDERDKLFENAAKEVAELVKPKNLALADLFSGVSVNHHERDKSIALAKRAMEDKLILRKEAEEYIEALKFYLSFKTKKIYLKYGNHEEFLDRWLETGDFKRNPVNAYLGYLLSNAKIHGYNPLQYLVEDHMNFRNSKLHFLKKGESLEIEGIENSRHGHEGINGRRGLSLRSAEEAYGKCTIEHSHSPNIQNGVYQNGTGSNLNPVYADPNCPNSRAQSMTLQFSGGTRQMIFVLRGKWR